MREIWLARLDKVRPCLILTRDEVRPYRDRVSVAGITTTRGLPAEVAVGAENGINVASVINLDDIQTIPAADLMRLVGYFPEVRTPEITAAILAAFDLPG